MGLFGDLFNYTKENYNRSKQAREYLRRAEELVEEGNRIYEQAYSKVASYAGETEYRLSKHMDFKKDIIRELNGNIATSLKEFRSFNIESRIINYSTMQKNSINFNTAQDLNKFNSSISSFIRTPDILMKSISDMFISDEDYYAARCKRDEARMYKDDMKRERERLYFYKEKMSEIRSFMDSEKNELNILMSKLRQMISDLKRGMQKVNYSNQEAEYLKAIHKIAEDLSNLLLTEFLTDNFFISQRYTKAFENIKKINENLPSSPSITDTNTLRVIARILGGNL